MADRILRWGLLSTARINRALIPPLRISERNQLSAVASRNLEAAKEYAREWDIPGAFGSYEAMLADPEIDVIYNSLPNAMHAEWTIKAVQAGKHVLCEKPLALSVEDVDLIAETASQAGVVVAEAFMYRHHPQTLRVKELVEDGTLGKLQLIRGSFTFKIENRENVRLKPELGGGSIWDVGCYPINYARFLVGAQPEEVFGWHVPGISGVDETFVGQMRFPGEVMGQFDSGFQTPLRAQLEVVGSEASLTLSAPFKPGLHEAIQIWHGDEVQAVAISGQELYLGEVEDMADAILLGKTPRISLDDSRGNVMTILAFLQSARQGQPVSMG